MLDWLAYLLVVYILPVHRLDVRTSRIYGELLARAGRWAHGEEAP